VKRDILGAIEADLDAAAAEKRRHFLPALIGATSLIVALLAMGGIRDDFVDMPPWRQIALAGSWIVCGLLFPAVGVGLWFPRRATRIGLVVTGIALPLSAVVGWPLGHEEPHGAAPCGIALFVLGAGLVGIGALSGAFAQRRSVGSSAWVATGLTLAALATTSWVCPVDEGGHLTWGHVVPGLVFATVAVVLGRWLHARQRR